MHLFYNFKLIYFLCSSYYLPPLIFDYFNTLTSTRKSFISFCINLKFPSRNARSPADATGDLLLLSDLDLGIRLGFDRLFALSNASAFALCLFLKWFSIVVVFWEQNLFPHMMHSASFVSDTAKCISYFAGNGLLILSPLLLLLLPLPLLHSFKKMLLSYVKIF